MCSSVRRYFAGGGYFANALLTPFEIFTLASFILSERRKRPAASDTLLSLTCRAAIGLFACGLASISVDYFEILQRLAYRVPSRTQRDQL